MKTNKYTKPIITVEELAKFDVLCASTDVDVDNQFVSSDSLLDYIFSGEWNL